MALPAHLAHLAQFDGLIDLVVEELVRGIEGGEGADEVVVVVKERPGKAASFGSSNSNGNNSNVESIIETPAKQTRRRRRL